MSGQENPLCQFDCDMIKKYGSIIGTDEAGRGPLAGPVTAAAVSISPNKHCEFLRDSKKMTASQREKAYEWILKNADAWAVYSVGMQKIHELNILHASMHAMDIAVSRIRKNNEHVLVDGNRLPSSLHTDSAEAIVGGDNRSYAIAAASVIAKVTRDRIMVRWGELYPGYGLEKHKGYGTAQHIKAIHSLLPLPIHRTDFSPIKQFDFPKKYDPILIGRWGENWAIYYLVLKGYKIIGRNIYCGHHGELDILCKNGEQYIAVEVKTTFGYNNDDYAKEKVTEEKIAKMMKAAEYYFYHLNMNEYSLRFDAVTVFGTDWRQPKIEHYKDIL